MEEWLEIVAEMLLDVARQRRLKLYPAKVGEKIEKVPAEKRLFLFKTTSEQGLAWQSPRRSDWRRKQRSHAAESVSAELISC